MDKKFLYRKTILKNLYNFSKRLDSIMDYEEYKRVILYDEESNYKYIDLLKDIYLGHYLIIANEKTESKIMISAFEELILKKDINLHIDLEKDLYEAVEIIIKNIKDEGIDIINSYALAYLLIDYVVYKKNKTMYRLSNRYLIKLYEVMKSKCSFEEVINFLKDEIERGYCPDIEFYKKFKEIEKEEIISTFIKNKEIINKKYSISHLYLYGSFIKGSERLDSDIDVAIIFNGNMSYKEKLKNVELLKEFIKKTFNRYGDVMEYNISILKDEKVLKIY